MKTLKTITILVSLYFLLAVPGNAISGESYSGTGFIESYPVFEKDKDRPGALVYYKPGIDLKTFTKIMIAPIEIWYAPDSKYKGIKPDDLKVISDAFQVGLIDELEPGYPVVSKPGPGVLGIRLAITNVYVQKKKKNIFSFTPIGLVVGAGMALAGKNISLTDATIEVEILDSQTNERLGVLIDKMSASKEKKKKPKTSWEEIQNTIKFYGKRFKASMDAYHRQ